MNVQADILMKPEVEALVHSSNGRFTVNHWLTQPRHGASNNGNLLNKHEICTNNGGSKGVSSGGSNRGSSHLARSVLPQPASVTGDDIGSTMVRNFLRF